MESTRMPLAMLGFWLLTTLLWWGFAFLPAESVSVEWLQAAQNACFGTLPNGLPDTYGWMLLILGPASFLIALWVTWPSELLQGVRDLKARPLGKSMLIFLIAFVAVEAYWVQEKVVAGIRAENFDFRATTEGNLDESYPRTRDKAPALELIDQNAQLTRLSDLNAKGKTVILSFAFAHCASICPALVTQLKEALLSLNPEEVELLLVSLDPRRDTPSSLPSLADRWKLPENARVLSGEVSAVEETLKRFKVPFARNETSGDIDHPALTYIISSEGEIAYTFNNAPPRWIAEAVQRLN